MSNAPLKKRSYGYLNQAPERQEADANRSSTQARHHIAQTRGWLVWLGWFLTLPFRLLGRLIRFLWPKGRTQHTSWGRFGRAIRRLLVVGIVAGLVGFGLLVAWVSADLPDPDKLTERQFAQSTKIYDRTGQHLLYEIFADEKRTLVDLKDIPSNLIHAVIATEDTQFYNHKGVRPLSMARSFAYGLVGKGRIGGGASTLTQQLVKNAVLNNERTLTRKLKEVILSVWLEQKYSKDQILKIYFNEIPYGSTNYGVESAAQSYFGKHVSEVSLAEAATLAGLPQKPSVFLNNPDALKNRRNFVLQRMVDEGYLNKEEADKAKAEPLNVRRQYTAMTAPHFVLYVKEQLVEKFGESTVDKGGLKVITTLDWDKQLIANKAIEPTSTAKLFEAAGANNAALLALDPRTGQILAMVGSRDFNDEKIDGQFNVVTLARRQPGSSIKPIIYAAAFEKGFTPSTVLYDVVTSYPNGDRAYTPHNYDLSEHGPVTMRQALQGSLNISAVKTLYLVGFKRALEFASRMGYTTFNNNIGLSLVLGGGEVNMLEHVNAYATLANNGTRLPAVSVLRVENPAHDVLYEWKAGPGTPVFDAKLAATVSNVLSDDASRVYVFGANSNLQIPGRQVAAKSGTTNNYVDAWSVGYTPSLAAGVWAGNTDNTPMKKGFGGNKVAGQIWNYFMRESLKLAPPEKFPSPPAVTSTKPILNGATGGGITLLVDSLTGKIATSSTPSQYLEERTYVTPHDILHYVDKDNPAGPVPERPELDPMYESWEQSLQNWIERKKAKDPNWNVHFEEPPTEYDDVHSLELIPRLEVKSPTQGAIVTSREVVTDIAVSAVRGISKVTYQLDGMYVGVVTEHPFNLNYHADTLEPGVHTLVVIAEDDVGNRAKQEVSFTLDVGAAQAGAHFVNPPTGILGMKNFPLKLRLTPFKPDEIKEVRVMAVNAAKTEKIVLTTVTEFKNLFNDEFFATWTAAPANGVWSLVVEITLANGNVYDSDSATVEIK